MYLRGVGGGHLVQLQLKSPSSKSKSSSPTRLRLVGLGLGLGGIERSRPSPPPPAVGLIPMFNQLRQTYTCVSPDVELTQIWFGVN